MQISRLRFQRDLTRKAYGVFETSLRTISSPKTPPRHLLVQDTSLISRVRLAVLYLADLQVTVSFVAIMLMRRTHRAPTSALMLSPSPVCHWRDMTST